MVVLWAIGAALSIVGSICSNLGVNVQKYSFMKNEKKPTDQQKGYCKQPLWLLGLAMVTFGSLGDFAALGLAAQSIVAPIGSVTLVANILFAHYWLKEKLARRDILGTVLIIAGSTTAVAFGDHTEVSYSLDDLKSYYTRSGFVFYGFIVVGCIIAGYMFVKKVQPIKVALNAAIKSYDAAVEKGDKAAELFQDEAIAALEKKYERYEKLHPFSYCALSGIFGAQSILFGKMVAELVRRSISGDNQMIYVLTYLFLVLMFTTVFSQLHFLAIALSFFDALYVVPVFQCFFITVSTLGGAAYFYEFSRFGALQWVMFPIGIFMTLTGVYLLSARSMRRSISHAAKLNTQAVAASDEDQVIELAENGEPPLAPVVEVPEEEFVEREDAGTPTSRGSGLSYTAIDSSDLSLEASTSSVKSARKPRPPPGASGRAPGAPSDRKIQEEAAAAARALNGLAGEAYRSGSAEGLLANIHSESNGMASLSLTDNNGAPLLPGMPPRSPVPGAARPKRPRPPSAPRTTNAVTPMIPATTAVPTSTTATIPSVPGLITPPQPKKTMLPRSPVVSVGAGSILTIAPPFALAITTVLPTTKPASKPPSPVISNRPFPFYLPERLPPWSSFRVDNYATTARHDVDSPTDADKMDIPMINGPLTIRSDDDIELARVAAVSSEGEVKGTPPRTPLGSPPPSAGGRALSRYARRRLTKSNLFATEDEVLPLAPPAGGAGGATAPGIGVGLPADSSSSSTSSSAGTVTASPKLISSAPPSATSSPYSCRRTRLADRTR